MRVDEIDYKLMKLFSPNKKRVHHIHWNALPRKISRNQKKERKKRFVFLVINNPGQTKLFNFPNINRTPLNFELFPIILLLVI